MNSRALRHVFGLCVVCAAVRAAEAPIDRIADSAVWRLTNRKAELVEDAGRKAVKLDARANDGMAWLVGSDFIEGTIDVDLRGANKPQQSFVGVALRGLNATTYDVVYFRPFNFMNTEIERRARAVQYISMPGFPWEKLRADSPGKYENTVNPVPDPDGWFHARVVVADRKISVYVNDAASPCLVVTELSERQGGSIGLWVGNGSNGAFANLKITPLKK
ncbi:MAG: hypothetical protein ABIZ04_04945 [Opitutus sp.]